MPAIWLVRPGRSSPTCCSRASASRGRCREWRWWHGPGCIASRRGVGSLGARLGATLLALPVLAAVLGGLCRTTRSAASGMADGGRAGGRVGRAVFATVLAAGRGVLGPLGTVFVWTFGLALAAVLTLLSLGLSLSEWRMACRMLSRAFGFVIAKGRLAAALLSRLGDLLGWAFSPVRRRRPIAQQRHGGGTPTSHGHRAPRPPVDPPQPRSAPSLSEAQPAVPVRPTPVSRRNAASAAGEPAAGGCRLGLSAAVAAEARARPRHDTGRARRRWRRTPGCWRPCCPTTACRAASWRSAPVRS